MPSKNSLQSSAPFDAFSQACVAWEAAQYQDVLTFLSGRGDAASLLLLARTYLRLKDESAAIKILSSARSEDMEESAEIAIVRTYAADLAALKATGSSPHNIAQISLRGSNARTKALLAFYRGSLFWLEKRFDEAAKEADMAIACGDRLIKAWGADLHGLIYSLQCDFAAATRAYQSALDFFVSSPTADERKRLTSLHGFALTSVEMCNYASFARLFEESDSMGSAPILGRGATQILTYAALAKTLLGDDEAAFELLLRACQRLAPAPFGALPHIELAALHLRRGSEDAAGLHFSAAYKIIDTTNWKLADDEARLLLLLFAATIAPLDRAVGSRVYTRATNLSGHKNIMLAYDHDGRGLALAHYARGAIALASEQNDQAFAHIRKAYDLWTGLGYRYRAAIASLDLLKLGNEDAFDEIKSMRRDSSKAWLWKEARERAIKVASPLNHVPPSQRLVMEGICEGLTSREIAARLGRSPATVRNQTISLFRRLGVSTRAALVALVKDSEY